MLQKVVVFLFDFFMFELVYSRVLGLYLIDKDDLQLVQCAIKNPSSSPLLPLLPAGLQSLTRYNKTTDWQKKLTPEQYVVTRERGTEVVSIPRHQYTVREATLHSSIVN